MNTHDPEEVLAFLEDTNVPITDQTTIQSLRADLRRIFQVKPGQPSNLSDKFLKAIIQRGLPIVQAPERANIRPIYVNYPWGRQLRFGIPGRRGLFGLASVNRYIQGL